MIAWRVCKAKHAEDLSGTGAAICGGRWNTQETAALYLGLSPAICCLESFVNASGPPSVPMKIVKVELPDDPALYWEPMLSELPADWDIKPYGSSSMVFGTEFLNDGQFLGLIVPSSVLPQERNILVNPNHQAAAHIGILSIADFFYDPRMFQKQV